MKVSIIGLGHVGSAIAFVLSLKSIIKELVLVGRTKESVMGDVLDLRHGQLFVDAPTKILAGEIEDTANSEVLVVCASVPMDAQMLDRQILGPANVALMANLLPKLAQHSPQAKLVIVSNPVDILVYFAIEFSGFSANSVIGTGTLVDSARFRQLIAEDIQIHTEDIRAYILGEHGQTQFPAMSVATAGGEAIDDTPHRRELFKQASQAGFEVLRRKGHTSYAIALAAVDIIHNIITDTKHTMPVSLKSDGYLGIDDVCLSLPAVIGKKGIERILHPKLNAEEQLSFLKSANHLRSIIGDIKNELKIK
ncbi:MAG TPA: lactate/malate dehydrogenase family protein [Cellvibrionaceae bacterium]